MEAPFSSSSLSAAVAVDDYDDDNALTRLKLPVCTHFWPYQYFTLILRTLPIHGTQLSYRESDNDDHKMKSKMCPMPDLPKA